MDAGRGDLPRFISDLEAGRLTPGRAEHVALLLQEAVAEEAAQLNALATARNWQLMFEPVGFDGRRTRGNAILSSRPMANRRVITLPRERQPRGAVAASVDVAGEQMFLVSAHLENRGSLWRALFSDIARRRQAKALIDSLPEDGFGVLGGDFNAWLGPNEPAWRVLLDRFDDTPGVMRTATFRDRLVLDHLLFDLPPGWRALTAVSRDRYASDHHPVIGSVIF
jgi:endonuclease/exonuclease/phosphatase family metal-dependent hydrolase